MASKTANVLARVEPEVKMQAESILETLGIPTSVLINMLYRQIILTKSIPFSISVPSVPLARDEMDKKAFNDMIECGIKDAETGNYKPASQVFDSLEKGLL